MAARPSTAAPILAVLAIVLPLLLLGAYLGGYFLMGECIHGFTTVPPKTTLIFRQYPYKWQLTLYWPMSKVEAWLRGNSVEFSIEAP